MYQNIDWFIRNAGSQEMADMGQRGYTYMLKHLTKDVSMRKYMDEISHL